MADRGVRSTSGALSNESSPDPSIEAPALDSRSSRDASQRAWLRNLGAALNNASSQDTSNVDLLGSPTKPPRAFIPNPTEFSSALRAPPRASSGPRPLQSPPGLASVDSTPSGLPDPFADDDPAHHLRQPRDPPPARSCLPSGPRDQSPPKRRLRLRAKPTKGKNKPKPRRSAEQKSSPQSSGRLNSLSARQRRPDIPPFEPRDSGGPPPPHHGPWPVHPPPPPPPQSSLPLHDEGRKTDARPPQFFVPLIRQDHTATVAMNGINGGNMGAGMVGPTPAGHQTELNYIYAMVEDLSRQLAENRRVLEEVVSLVGKIRSKARAQNVSNEEIITNAEDLNRKSSPKKATGGVKFARYTTSLTG